MKNSFLSPLELQDCGFANLGREVRISRLASIYHPELLSLGDFSRIDDFCILTGRILIGRNVHLGAFSGLYGASAITMEDFSSLSAHVTVYSESDDYVLGAGLTNPTVPPCFRNVFDKGPVLVERHAMVGCSTVILPNSTVGCGTTVGALSLVHGCLAPWSVYAGNPIKKLGNRRSSTILRMERELLDLEGK